MTIKKQAFTMALLPPPPEPGEVVFLNSSATTTFSWIVPANVYRISAVAVACPGRGGGQAYPKISRGAAVLLAPDMALGVGGVGGGNGGLPGGFNDTYYIFGGGGGAGGYTGNGGRGGDSANSPGTAGFAGLPGSGGGGGGAQGPTTRTPSATSGPVGLLGAGASGGRPNSEGVGSAGSNLGGVLCGAVWPGHPGGNLRWLNDIPVTPGETLTITMYQRAAPQLTTGANEGVRILWGNDGRSYPNNAGDTIPKGQLVFTSNTTLTVPPGVTSLCACAQQRDGNAAAVSLVVAGAEVLRAQNGARIGDGGGDGGAGGSGGGGGGGYGGDGGAGGGALPAGPGSGGAGAGGERSTMVWVDDPVVGGSDNSPGHWEGSPARAGGGVGISGQGASGTSPGAQGSPDPINGYMGGGAPGGAGGALSWKNAIAVTPGQVININAAGGRVRIIWGPGRSYPSAAGNA